MIYYCRILKGECFNRFGVIIYFRHKQNAVVTLIIIFLGENNCAFKEKNLEVMALEYISTFITGFSDIMPQVMKSILPKARIIKVYDGLINYTYDGAVAELSRVLFFNNTFRVISKFQGKSSNMDSMIRSATSIKNIPGIKQSFRIRFSENNRFVRVNELLVRRMEDKICKLTNTRIDRLSPKAEYWFIKRSENIGFFCLLVNRRKTTEKDLHKGELRPEFAYLMCLLGDINKTDIVFDPFAGYGAIPQQVIKYFPCKKIIASDINEQLITSLKKRFKNTNRIQVLYNDALHMDGMENSSIDCIITDPPWGYYEEIDNIEQFYTDMMLEFVRVLKHGGKLVLLSARKDEFVSALRSLNININQKYDTLVNGKKAAVYVVEL